MKCYSCRKYDTCPLDWKCSADMYDCSAYEVNQTNEEWFNNLPTEKKAEFMGDICGRGYLKGHFDGNFEFSKKQDKAYWEMWLKQPHEQKEQKGDVI